MSFFEFKFSSIIKFGDFVPLAFKLAKLSEKLMFFIKML